MIAVAIAVLVYLAFGVSHTKTVTQTKVVTRTLVKRTAAPRFDGTLSSLVEFLHPDTGRPVKCQANFPRHSICVQLGAAKWFVFFAAPASAAS